VLTPDKESALEFLISFGLSYGFGELSRFAARKAGAMEAGTASYRYGPAGVGLATGGAGAALGLRSKTAIAGFTAGSAATIARPLLFQSEEEEFEQSLNTLSDDPLFAPVEYKYFGKSQKQLMLGPVVSQEVIKQFEYQYKRSIAADFTGEKYVERQEPGKGKKINSSSWLAAMNTGDQRCYETPQLIVIENINDFKKIGDLLGTLLLLLIKGQKDVLVKKLYQFFNNAFFDASDQLLNYRVAQITEKFGQIVWPEGIAYPSVIRSHSIPRYTTPSGKMRAILTPDDEISYLKDKADIKTALNMTYRAQAVMSRDNIQSIFNDMPFLLEYAMMYATAEGMKAVADPEKWKKAEGAVTDALVKGAMGLAGPAIGGLLAAAGVASTVPVAGWIVGAGAAIAAGITAIFAGFKIGDAFAAEAKKRSEALLPILNLFRPGYDYGMLPGFTLGLQLHGGSFGDVPLWQIFSYQEEFGVFRKIIAQLPVFYHNVEFDIPVHKDVWRVTYVSSSDEHGYGV